MKVGSCKICKKLVNFQFKKQGLEIRDACEHIDPLTNINRNFSLRGRKKIIFRYGSEKKGGGN